MGMKPRPRRKTDLKLRELILGGVANAHEQMEEHLSRDDRKRYRLPLDVIEKAHDMIFDDTFDDERLVQEVLTAFIDEGHLRIWSSAEKRIGENFKRIEKIMKRVQEDFRWEPEQS